MPGVSTIATAGRPSISSKYSVAREVVGSGPAADRTSWASALTRLDLPALIWPASTSRTGAGSSAGAASFAAASRNSSGESVRRPE